VVFPIMSHRIALVRGVKNETCIDSSVSSKWIVFNDDWIVIFLLEKLVSKLFLYTQSIPMYIQTYFCILQYRNIYFNIEIKDIISKCVYTIISNYKTIRRCNLLSSGLSSNWWQAFNFK